MCMYMYNQFSIAPPYSVYFVISRKCPLCRGFLDSWTTPYSGNCLISHDCPPYRGFTAYIKLPVKNFRPKL